MPSAPLVCPELKRSSVCHMDGVLHTVKAGASPAVKAGASPASGHWSLSQTLIEDMRNTSSLLMRRMTRPVCARSAPRRS